jgi:hypothetical protein
MRRERLAILHDPAERIIADESCAMSRHAIVLHFGIPCSDAPSFVTATELYAPGRSQQHFATGNIALTVFVIPVATTVPSVLGPRYDTRSRDLHDIVHSDVLHCPERLEPVASTVPGFRQRHGMLIPVAIIPSGSASRTFSSARCASSSSVNPTSSETRSPAPSFSERRRPRALRMSQRLHSCRGIKQPHCLLVISVFKALRGIA